MKTRPYWDPIHGELVIFIDPQRGLPPIDRLEGLRPGGLSMYQRVVVAAVRGSIACAVWTYTIHKRQPSRFLEKSALFGTKRLILAIHQSSLWRLFAALCPDFGFPGDLRAFTENMMNEGRRLWMRDG